jgi:hypothetical protein
VTLYPTDEAEIGQKKSPQGFCGDDLNIMPQEIEKVKRMKNRGKTSIYG